METVDLNSDLIYGPLPIDTLVDLHCTKSENEQ